MAVTLVSSMACEVEFTVLEAHKKTVYKADEEIVVLLKVVYTHRKCDINIENSKIGATGGKITGATKWTQTSPGIYERKLKVKVVKDDLKELKVVCQRTCDKEGGHAELVLNKE